MENPENLLENPKYPETLKKLQAEVQSLQQTNQNLELNYKEAEQNLLNLQHELDDAQKRNIEFAMAIEEVSIERDCLKSEIVGVEARVREREEEFSRRVDDGVREKECLEVEIYEGMREREELVRKIDVGMREKEGLLKENVVLKGRVRVLEEKLLVGMEVVNSIKGALIRVSEGLSEKLESGVDHGCEEKEVDVLKFEGQLEFVSRMVERVEEKLGTYQEKEDLLKEIEAYKRRNEELVESLSRGLEVLGSMKVYLMRVIEALDQEVGIGVDHECEEVKDEVIHFEENSEELEVKAFYVELKFVLKLAKRVEEKLNDYQEKIKKDKRQLENSVVSLTEENRDVNALLRIALVEKEAVEKSLNKVKGNNEQKSFALLQIAERGLQRVGFGFIMGGAANEHCEQQKENPQTSENLACNTSTVSDVSSEYEEDVVCLTSTLEKMMKNLRLEIAQLRRALEESRSDIERLQSSTEKQAQQITAQRIYIKELEDRERTLFQNVEHLQIEIKASEEDVERWREACELEVEAGKRAVEERDKVIAILKHELKKTRNALEVSNSKLKLKEELADAAMVAQSAAERSLQLADRRAAGLYERIEELTRQLEEAETREKNSRSKVRRICWPWQALNLVKPATFAGPRARNIDVRHILPNASLASF